MRLQSFVLGFRLPGNPGTRPRGRHTDDGRPADTLQYLERTGVGLHSAAERPVVRSGIREPARGLTFFPLFLLLSIFLRGACFAEGQAILLTDDVQLKIADSFMEEKEYYRAVTEYKKYLILFPASDKCAYARFRIGTAYYSGEEYESAAKAFALLRQSGPEEYGVKSGYFEALSYWKLKKLNEAMLTFRELAATHPQSELAPNALAASSLVALEKGDIAGSRADMTLFIERYPLHPGWSRIREARSMLWEHESLPRKSGVLASVMSAILPGSGYVYAGSFKDGITAFIINGLAAAGVATGVHQENLAVSGIVAGVGLPFYFGNIYGSANAVRKWNAAAKEKHLDKIRNTLGFDF